MTHIHYFTVTKVKGPIEHNLPKKACFTIRGYRKGAKAKTGKCISCGGIINIGEQYIRLDEVYSYCLACVEYT